MQVLSAEGGEGRKEKGRRGAVATPFKNFLWVREGVTDLHRRRGGEKKKRRRTAMGNHSDAPLPHMVLREGGEQEGGKSMK